jgi:predicted transcriptional regulator
MLQELMPSKRPTILVRLDDEAKAALLKAAKADDRSAQYVAEKAILEWLRGNNFLAKPKREPRK